MRTISSDVAVRLYQLGDEGVATTIFYGALAEALAIAATLDGAVQDELYLQTSNDVVSYRNLIAD